MEQLGTWAADEIRRQEAEIIRLRSALREIVAVDAPKVDEGELMAEIAQRALRGD